MVDTVGIRIPINSKTYADLARQQNTVLEVTNQGDVVWSASRGYAKGSFENVWRWSLKTPKKDSLRKCDGYLCLVGSLPKMIYGHNARLLEDEWQAYLALVRGFAQQALGVDLIDWQQWEVYRIDLCFNYVFENPHEICESLKDLDYPRKQKYIYADAVMWVGDSYTLKFYEKEPETKIHKNNKPISNLEAESQTEALRYSKGVLRYELTLKETYLQSLFDCDTIYADQITTEIITTTINKTLKKLFTMNTETLEIHERIDKFTQAGYTMTEAIRLEGMYHVLQTIGSKCLGARGLNRVKLWRDKDKIKKAGVSLDNRTNSSIGFDLLLPSPRSQLLLFPRL